MIFGNITLDNSDIHNFRVLALWLVVEGIEELPF